MLSASHVLDVRVNVVSVSGPAGLYRSLLSRCSVLSSTRLHRLWQITLIIPLNNERKQRWGLIARIFFTLPCLKTPTRDRQPKLQMIKLVLRKRLAALQLTASILNDIAICEITTVVEKRISINLCSAVQITTGPQQQHLLTRLKTLDLTLLHCIRRVGGI